MAVYAAMIEGIDTSVGRLVKGLEARGILDNTMILFLSDNGANAESGPEGRLNGDPPGLAPNDRLASSRPAAGRPGPRVPPPRTSPRGLSMN